MHVTIRYHESSTAHTKTLPNSIPTSVAMLQANALYMCIDLQQHQPCYICTTSCLCQKVRGTQHLSCFLFTPRDTAAMQEGVEHDLPGNLRSLLNQQQDNAAALLPCSAGIT